MPLREPESEIGDLGMVTALAAVFEVAAEVLPNDLACTAFELFEVAAFELPV